MISPRQFEDFFTAVMPNNRNFLTECVDWIRDNLDLEEVFTGNQLRDWAIDHGYVEKE